MDFVGCCELAVMMPPVVDDSHLSRVLVKLYMYPSLPCVDVIDWRTFRRLPSDMETTKRRHERWNSND